MIVALVTDTHAGVRNDSDIFANMQDTFWSQQFFPECADRGVKTILHLGDFFDRRQYINFKTYRRVVDGFISLLDQYDMNMILIVGNHDVFYKNKNDVNAPSLVFGPRVRVLTTAEALFDTCLMVPWINSSNYHETMNTLKESTARFVFGHFEIGGFEMHKGQVAHDGLPTDIFDKFNHVFSGHFHTRSTKGNITYLGSPFELTWSDFDDVRGYHFFDTDTGSIEFVQRKGLNMFIRIEYTDDEQTYEPIEDVTNCFVKLFVYDNKSKTKLAQFITDLENRGACEVQVIDMATDVTGLSLSENIEDVEMKSTLQLAQEYVELLPIDDKKKNKLKKHMTFLYHEASQE